MNKKDNDTGGGGHWITSELVIQQGPVPHVCITREAQESFDEDALDNLIFPEHVEQARLQMHFAQV